MWLIVSGNTWDLQEFPSLQPNWKRVDDDCTLYIRFNKQEAYLGKLMTTTKSDSILVRIKIKAYPARADKAIQVALSLLGEGD